MAYEFDIARSAISAIITILITTLFIHFAAKFVLGRGSFVAALLTALLATFLAELFGGLVGQMSGNTIAAIATGIAVWALVAAIFFRARWVQGAIIGLVAWVLWALVHWLIGMFF